MFLRHFVEASGDFQLMRREHWATICGYAEAPTYGHFDTVLMYQAHLMGFKIHLLRAPVVIFHSQHQVCFCFYFCFFVFDMVLLQRGDFTSDMRDAAIRRFQVYTDRSSS